MAKRTKAKPKQEVVSNGNVPEGYAVVKRERVIEERGREQRSLLGFVVRREGKDGKPEYAGRTNCWHPMEIMADPLFDTEHDAAKVARYMHSQQQRTAKSAAADCEIEIKELLVPVANPLPADAPRQIKLTMTHAEAVRLKAVLLGARKENIHMENGKPIVSIADAFRYIVSLL